MSFRTARFSFSSRTACPHPPLPTTTGDGFRRRAGADKDQEHVWQPVVDAASVAHPAVGPRVDPLHVGQREDDRQGLGLRRGGRGTYV